MFDTRYNPSQIQAAMEDFVANSSLSNPDDIAWSEFKDMVTYMNDADNLKRFKAMVTSIYTVASAKCDKTLPEHMEKNTKGKVMVTAFMIKYFPHIALDNQPLGERLLNAAVAVTDGIQEWIDHWKTNQSFEAMGSGASEQLIVAISDYIPLFKEWNTTNVETSALDVKERLADLVEAMVQQGPVLSPERMEMQEEFIFLVGWLTQLIGEDQVEDFMQELETGHA